MDKTQKQDLIDDLRGKFGTAKAVILADYTGLSVSEVDALRNDLRQSQVEFKVVKNTLAKRAAAGTDVEKLASYMEGPTGVIFGFEDGVSPTKAIINHAKGQKKLKVKVGIVEGAIADEGQLKSIAMLPSREDLLSMMAAGFQAPLSKMARLLGSMQTRLLYAFTALEKKKAEAA